MHPILLAAVAVPLWIAVAAAQVAPPPSVVDDDIVEVVDDDIVEVVDDDDVEVIDADDPSAFEDGEIEDSEAEAGEAATEPSAKRDDEIEIRERRYAEPTVQSRASHRTTRKQMDERQVRSAPDALQYTPGVYVQQTSHSQASPFIRGRTGRQTLLLFDGLRINNALFRQGPNQYLFTVDARSIESIEVVRGSASVELGANAMAGAILVHPAEPKIDPYRSGFTVRPKVSLRHATADDEIGGRVEGDFQFGFDTGLLLGIGYRDVGKLRASGDVGHLKATEGVDFIVDEKEVPRFEDDGRTQMGTGFEEMAGDARLVHQLSAEDRLILATYVYRQFDAPRTDQCPPPEAPDHWCLVYEQQFRTSAYAKAELTPRWVWLARTDFAASYARQHERRANNRGFIINGGRDDIDVYNAYARGETAVLPVASWSTVHINYGLDGGHERVSSAAWDRLTNVDVTRNKTRGQYLDGSYFTQAGVFVAPRWTFGERLTLRAGARGSIAAVHAPDDVASETRGVDETWSSVVNNAGIEWHPAEPLTISLNAEQGFRPPNLDDLSARQLTGQGIQIENPDLTPESAWTFELGAKWKTRRLDVNGWLYQSYLTDTMERRDAKCPESEGSCGAARARPFQLVNLGGTAIIRGAEVDAGAKLGLGFALRATVAYAWGEGDSPIATEAGEKRPLSRIPPLNGTGEIKWRHLESGFYVSAAMRWATDQDRLAFGDEIDRRIPFGGTPGYRVYDLRAGLRWPNALNINVALQNLTDVPYRIHGSSVNGAERGLVLSMEVQP